MEPRISFTWPSSVEGTFGINLVDDINRLVRKTKFELVIMAYNLNVSSDFFLQQTIRDRLRMCKPKIKLFCDNFNTASSFADLFNDWRSELEVWYWTDPSQSYSKFHIKAIAVDKSQLYIGSANFSETAMEDSAECGLFLTSPDSYESLLSYAEKLIKSGLLTKLE